MPLELAACVREFGIGNSVADNKLGEPPNCSCLVLFGLFFLFGVLGFFVYLLDNRPRTQ